MAKTLGSFCRRLQENGCMMPRHMLCPDTIATNIGTCAGHERIIH